MLKVSQEWIDEVSRVYPGFEETVASWESLKLPPCPLCGSTNVAKVSAGIVGRSIHLAAASTKIKLPANGHPADYFCNVCKAYFD